MKLPENKRNILFGGTFLLANKLQLVGDKVVDGLSTKQWFLLKNLIDLPRDPLPTITQVANEMNSTRQNVTKMLTSMQKEGLVSVEKSDTDHRSYSVGITQYGIETAKKTAKNAGEFLDGIFRGIEESDWETAGKVLIKMLENLETIKEEIDEK